MQYTIKKNENLSTIAKNAGMSYSAFAALNPHLTGSGAGSYKGLKNTVAVGTGYNLSNPNAPVVTPASTTPTVPTPVTTATGQKKYARVASPYDTRIREVTDKMESYNKEPDYRAIREEKRAMAQAVIDSVNAQFASTIAGQKDVNAKMNDRVRAGNISSGLAGSDFATTKAIDQETKGKTALDMIEAEKAAKVNAILAEIDSSASEEYRRQREDYVRGLGDNLDMLRDLKKQDREQATANVQALAKMNVSLDKMKSEEPDAYNTLLEQYGGSDMDLEGVWNEALPDNMRIKYEQKIIQGKDGKAVVLRYGINPQTGEIDEREYPLNTDYNSLTGAKPVNVGGRLYTMTTDADGNEIARPLTDYKPTASKTSTGTGKVFKSGKASFSESQLSDFSATLEKSKTLYGGDGRYVNPEVYLQAYQAWTDPEVGGLAKDFLAKYPPKTYVNPANTTLPSYLLSKQPTAKKGTTTTTSGRKP